MSRKPAEAAPRGGGTLPGRAPSVGRSLPPGAAVTDRDAEATAAAGGWALIRRQMVEQWAGILVGVVLGLAWTAGRVSIPTFVQRAIDEGMDAGDVEQVDHWAMVIVAVAVVTAACTGGRRYMAFREARRAEAAIRDRLFAHLVRLSFPFHDRTATGQLMSRANLDLQQVQNFFALLPLTFANMVTVLAAVVLLLRIDVVLTLLALGGLPLIVVFAKRMSTRLFPTMVAVQQESAELAEVVEETVSGIRVVKGFGAEAAQARRLAVEADDVYDASMAGSMIRARYWPLLELLPSLGLVLVLAYGGHLAIDGELTVGQLVAFNAYVALLVWPMRMLGWIVALAQRAVAAAGRVDELLSTGVEVDEPRHPRRLPDRDDDTRLGAVCFDGVDFSYQDGAPVLAGFDLTIAPGESVALVGATGSGKSTVARLLCRFYDVDGGSIRLDGLDVREVGLGSLRRQVALVFEETFLFSDTIAANIAFARPDAERAAVERAARLAGADEFIRELADGYDTPVGERGFALSGGQRQRLAIARAVLAEPRVLVLDDATSAVDPRKEHEIRDSLTEVMRGRTTIVIAHRPATIALADRVVLIDGGRVAAEGRHADLLAGNGLYREVLAAADGADQEARAGRGA